jgi:uncharacterized protein
MNRKQLLHAATVAEERATKMARHSVFHGPRHWQDVARIGRLLIGRGVEADSDVVFLFAALHDSQRRSEGSDPKHGERAATVAADMRAKGIITISNPRWRLLRQALIEHDRGLVSDDPTIATCWDADRLSLPRVGIRVRADLLSGDVALNCVVDAMAIVNSDGDSWSGAITGRTKSDTGSYILYHGTCNEFGHIIAQHGLKPRAHKPPPYATRNKQRAYQYGIQAVAARLAARGNYDGLTAPPCWIVTLSVDPALLIQDEQPDDYALPLGARAEAVIGVETRATVDYLRAPGAIRHHAGVVRSMRRRDYGREWPDWISVYERDQSELLGGH